MSLSLLPYSRRPGSNLRLDLPSGTPLGQRIFAIDALLAIEDAPIGHSARLRSVRHGEQEVRRHLVLTHTENGVEDGLVLPWDDELRGLLARFCCDPEDLLTTLAGRPAIDSAEFTRGLPGGPQREARPRGEPPAGEIRLAVSDLLRLCRSPDPMPDFLAVHAPAVEREEPPLPEARPPAPAPAPSPEPGIPAATCRPWLLFTRTRERDYHVHGEAGPQAFSREARRLLGVEILPAEAAIHLEPGREWLALLPADGFRLAVWSRVHPFRLDCKGRQVREHLLLGWDARLAPWLAERRREVWAWVDGLVEGRATAGDLPLDSWLEEATWPEQGAETLHELGPGERLDAWLSVAGDPPPCFTWGWQARTASRNWQRQQPTPGREPAVPAAPRVRPGSDADLIEALRSEKALLEQERRQAPRRLMEGLMDWWRR